MNVKAEAFQNYLNEKKIGSSLDCVGKMSA